MHIETDYGIDGVRLDLPFPSEVSPDVDRARERHYAWVAQHGLWPDRKAEYAYKHADFPLFIAHVYPWASGEDLDLVTDLVGWAWLWDDSLDRQARFPWTEDVLEAYFHGMIDPSREPAEAVAIPLVHAWRTLNRRLLARTSTAWRARHEAHWAATFKGYLEEARNNATETIPTLEEYFELRRKTSGPETTFDWIEAAGHFEVPTAIHATEAMLRLRRDAVDLISISNDLVSARNEWSEGNTDNIVIVLAYQEQCTWPEAARIAESIAHSIVENFLATEQQLLASDLYQALAQDERADTDRLINCIKHWIGGSHTWHLDCPRYKVPATRPLQVPPKNTSRSSRCPEIPRQEPNRSQAPIPG
ncbi:terpene synthase family protein [Saccharopolyspora pogona]|uniref:terpene synthase family protein n=1 Tax=Saccharopolyspora pogona TaxID=333966 RepID=UPI0016842755|nr:hypothetical protein [Saccharopolyspora pogona]